VITHTEQRHRVGIAAQDRIVEPGIIALQPDHAVHKRFETLPRGVHRQHGGAECLQFAAHDVGYDRVDKGFAGPEAVVEGADADARGPRDLLQRGVQAFARKISSAAARSFATFSRASRRTLVDRAMSIPSHFEGTLKVGARVYLEATLNYRKAGTDMTAHVAASTRLTIDVWADVLCPWCYLGEQRLSTAIQQSPHAGDIDLRIHTFQLDPTFPTTVMPTLEYLSTKYGVAADQARAMEESMAQQAAAEGLTYKIDRPARNTLDLLRLVHLGAKYGVAWEYLRTMQAEVFGGNNDAYEHSTLERIGESLGIPLDEIRDLLTTDRYADAVRADHDAASAWRARGAVHRPRRAHRDPRSGQRQPVHERHRRGMAAGQWLTRRQTHSQARCQCSSWRARWPATAIQ